MRRLLCLLAAAATAACSATVATGAAFTARTANPGSTFTAAASFCSSPQTVTITSDNDSWVDQASASTTHGDDATLTVTSRNGNRNARALVGFTLPSAGGCTITAATLRMTAASAATGRTLNATRLATTTWTEAAVNWATQPATTGAAATTTSGAGLREWTVTAQVAAMYAAGETTGGFRVADSAEANNPAVTQSFSSSEAAANRPQLVVSFG